jgi:hypothetical protein
VRLACQPGPQGVSVIANRLSDEVQVLLAYRSYDFSPQRIIPDAEDIRIRDEWTHVGWHILRIDLGQLHSKFVSNSQSLLASVFQQLVSRHDLPPSSVA